MPSIKRIGKLDFGRNDPEIDSWLDEDDLAWNVTVVGYPTADEDTGRRKHHGEGTWQLSQASYEAQELMPMELTTDVDTADLTFLDGAEPDGQLWMYQGWAFSSDDQQGLRPEDVRALVNVEVNKRRLTLEKAHALQAMTENYDRPKRREPIAQTVRIEVWQRDGGRCVECDSNEKLEFDQTIPVAMGGGNTSRNLQLLCETCNRRKGASLG